MRVTKEGLDEIATRYHASAGIADKFIEDALQRHTLSWIRDQLSERRSVLELGFGEGLVTADLVRNGKDVTVLEGSAVLVQRAAALHGGRLRCVHGLFEEFVPAAGFDAVVASHVLEHVDDPVALLARMRSWITPQGRILIIVPNSESIHRRLAVLMGIQARLDSLGERDHLVGHQRVYSLAGLIADVRAAGLDVHSSRGFFFKPLPNSMMLQFSPALIDAMNSIDSSMPTDWLANLGLVAELQR